ncbi:hypothetical protein MVEN_00586400 [Mycena venus]|uniref:Uncharacterized protein n=1 Tax=Mycena venus TaxID=2733690 RepID=A0A8H6YM02_9AGAR|nr:hypothetical protein MVEN_00586400 [Mycena venus]
MPLQAGWLFSDTMTGIYDVPPAKTLRRSDKGCKCCVPSGGGTPDDDAFSVNEAVLGGRKFQDCLAAVVYVIYTLVSFQTFPASNWLSLVTKQEGYRKPTSTSVQANEEETHRFRASSDSVGSAEEPRLIELRADFLGDLATRDPGLRALYGSISTDYEFLLAVIPSRKAVQLFAKYIHLVLCAFQDTPRYSPVAFRTTA